MRIVLAALFCLSMVTSTANAGFFFGPRVQINFGRSTADIIADELRFQRELDRAAFRAAELRALRDGQRFRSSSRLRNSRCR